MTHIWSFSFKQLKETQSILRRWIDRRGLHDGRTDAFLRSFLVRMSEGEINSNIAMESVPAHSKNISELIECAEHAERVGDFLLASFSYRDALDFARKASDGTSIKVIKRKIKGVNKKAQDNFKEISFGAKIPTKEIDAFIHSIIGLGTLNESLLAIGRHPFFRPILKNVRETAEKTLPISYQIATYTTLSEDGHFVSNDGDVRKSWLFKVYAIGQELSTRLYLGPTLEKLKDTKGLNTDNLVLYLRGNGIFEERDLQFIEIGMRRFFEKDFVSVLHVLTPRLESVFLGLSNKLGLDTVALNRTKDVSTQETTLSIGMLNSEEFKKVWSEDFCFQLVFVLFEPLGYALRNKISHGTVRIEECNEFFANLVVYFFLVFAAVVKRVP